MFDLDAIRQANLGDHADNVKQAGKLIAQHGITDYLAQRLIEEAYLAAHFAPVQLKSDFEADLAEWPAL